MKLLDRREGLVLMAASLSACTTMNANPNTDSRMQIDDGISELTPVYVMTYLQGQPAAFVRADFFYQQVKKEIEIQPGGSIKVNGVALQRDPKERVSYIGYIPLPFDLLTFEFTRASGQVFTHSFALPELNILEYPKTYRAPDALIIPVRHRAPRVGVTRDVYGLTMNDPRGEVYPFAISQVHDEKVEFDPILKKLGLSHGEASLHMVRQQRTVLKNISNAFQTGWAVASTSHDFKVEVVQ